MVPPCAQRVPEGAIRVPMGSQIVFGASQTAQCIPKAVGNRYFLYGMYTTPTLSERFTCDRGGVAPVNCRIGIPLKSGTCFIRKL